MGFSIYNSKGSVFITEPILRKTERIFLNENRDSLGYTQ